MEDNTITTVEDTKEKKKVRKSKKVKKILISITFFSLLFLAYLYSVYYFSNHYFYKTRINGEDCSFLTDSEVRSKINRKISLYELEIIGKDGVIDKISADDIELSLVYDCSMEKIRQKENPFLWMTAFFTGYDFELEEAAEFNEELFNEAVENLVFYNKSNIKKSKNAYIGDYDESTGAFSIVKEETGNEPEDEKLKEVLSKKIKSLQDVVYLEREDCYKTAEITSDNSKLIKELTTLNSYVSAKITYDWNGAEEVVDGKLISEWLVREDGKVSLNEELVAEYVTKKSREHDTYGKERSFVTADGREIMLKSGNYGWRTARDEETEALIEAICQCQVVEREPIYIYTAVQKGENDIGNSYVEIDLGSQKLYLFSEGSLILETDLVSGNVSRGWTTPAGVFGLNYKTKNAVLRGDNYETPVNYWMPFNGNIGMHDATWRGSFGGDIYMTNGSHGCINLPLDAAAQIYEYVSTGFPIVCYY